MKQEKMSSHNHLLWTPLYKKESSNQQYNHRLSDDTTLLCIAIYTRKV